MNDHTLRYTRRSLTGDYRFSLPMLLPHLSRSISLPELRAKVLEAGAVSVGKARVNYETGQEVMKDSVYSVVDIESFMDELSELCSKPLPKVTSIVCPCCEARLSIAVHHIKD